MSYERLQYRYKRKFLFRSLGLELPALLTFDKPVEEVPKPVYRASLKAALSNSAIHILPILACLTAVTLNLRNLYLGRTLVGQILDASTNIAMLQVAAKLVELLIIASLTNMVVHTIRKEMALGDGVPLGAISGAFMFSNLSYLWSPELWGSIRAKLSWRAKIRVYGILMLSGLLATTTGPSTAVLLIPKDQKWNAGGSDIYIRGSAEEVWPSRLEFSVAGVEPFCSMPNATSYGVCPSGGYMSMLSYSAAAFQRHNSREIQRNASNFAFGPKPVLVPTISNQMPSMSLTGSWRSFACETSVSGVHGAEAMYLSQLLRDWNQIVMSIPYAPLRASTGEYKYSDDVTATTKSRIPVIKVACSDAQNISSLNNEIQFPYLPEHGCWNSTMAFQYPNLNQTASNRLRTAWVPLPEKFGRTSTGLLFEAPWVEGGSRAVLGCSIDARWANATLSSTADTANPSDPTNRNNPGSVCQASVTKMGPENALSRWPEYSIFAPSDDSAWSPIKLQQSWLDILTPFVETSENSGGKPWQTKTIDRLLSGPLATDNLVHPNLSQTTVWNWHDLGSLNRTVTLEWVVALILADGLSREGSSRVLNTTGDPASWKILDYNKTTDFSSQLLNGGQPLEEPNTAGVMKTRASILISGYSYKASAVTDYLSISILLLYVIIAIYHTIYFIIRRQVSDCWDTITEFFALMQNSRPAHLALKNTCAGIKELSTYAQIAVIRVHRLNDTVHSATGAPHLEVVFREEDEKAPVHLRSWSDDSASSSTRLLRRQGHSRTWAPGSISGDLREVTLDNARKEWRQWGVDDTSENVERESMQSAPIVLGGGSVPADEGSQVQVNVHYG